MKNSTIKLLQILLCVAGFAAGARAAIVTVTNTNDAGAGSLRNAIAVAASGDTIVFNLPNCPCTIQLASGLSVQKSLTIQGLGANQLTVRGNASASVFTIANPNSQTAVRTTISGLTITNGANSTLGGGVQIFATAQSRSAIKATIVDSVIANNRINGTGSGGAGGGIGAIGDFVTLNVFNTLVSNNTVAGVSPSNSGGGIVLADGSFGGTVLLVNSTVSDNSNSSGGGGGVSVPAGSTLTVVNSSIANNAAARAGGINNAGTGTIRGGSISGNTALEAGGGGIRNSGSLTLVGVAISGNTADALLSNEANGGAIENTGTLALASCSVVNNTAFAFGGGIASNGILNVQNSTFSGNTARQQSGGAIAGGASSNPNVAAKTMITNSTFFNNTARERGGAIESRVSLEIVNSTVSGNRLLRSQTLSGAGGGIAADFSENSAQTARIVNCTIAFNSAALGGGVLGGAPSGSSVVLRNTIIARNAASGDETDAVGSFDSEGNNLIGIKTIGTEGVGNGVNDDQVGSRAQPIDPLLAPLAANGGATQTHALLPGSPAIDRGNSAFGVTTDQRGRNRFFDDPTVPNIAGIPNADIGAFELQAPTAAAVNIGGQVLTNTGKGLRGARVFLIAPNGTERSVLTSAFGYYRFAQVAAGESHLVRVESKRYNFDAQTISANSDVTDLNFMVQP